MAIPLTDYKPSRKRFCDLIRSYDEMPVEIKIDLLEIGKTLDDRNKECFILLASGYSVREIGVIMHELYPGVAPDVIGGGLAIDRLRRHFKAYILSLYKEYQGL